MEGIRVCVPSARQVRLERFEIDERELNPSEVIIKTHYTTISPGTELAIYTAHDPDVYNPKGWCHYPFKPGYISVGEIIAMGTEVRDFNIGDLVFCYSNHASIAKVDTRGFIVKVPSGIDEKLVGFTRMATIAMTALRVSSMAAGDMVAVFGLGLVGNLACQLFRLSGADTIGIDLSIKRLELAHSFGIKHLVNPAHQDIRDYIMRLTNGRGVNIVVEAIGKPELIPLAADIAAYKGEVILLGTPRDDYQADLTPLLRNVHLRGIGLKGALEWLLPVREIHNCKFSIEGNTKYVFGLIRDGRLEVKSLLTHVIGAGHIQDAYEGLLNRRDEFLGVVVDWSM